MLLILTGKTTAIQQDANTKPGGRTRREVWLVYLFSYAVQNLIHLHASRVPVVPKPNDDHAVFFRKDGLIHLPAVVQVREHVRHLEPTGLRGSGGKSPASSSQLPHGTPKEPPTPRSLTTESPHEVSPCGAPTPQSLTTGPLPHGPSPRACSNSCPLSQWCHPTISSSVVPFSSCLQHIHIYIHTKSD